MAGPLGALKLSSSPERRDIWREERENNEPQGTSTAPLQELALSGAGAGLGLGWGWAAISTPSRLAPLSVRIIGTICTRCSAQPSHTARKIHNRSTIIDCKLFSQSHCRELLYLPRRPHLWCTRNIVTTQLQHCFVNYFHNIFCRMVEYFLQWCCLQCTPIRQFLRADIRQGFRKFRTPS